VIDVSDPVALRQAIEFCRGDSVWLDAERLVEEIQDKSTDENEAKRFYLNRLAVGSERAFDLKRWKQPPLGMTGGSQSVKEGGWERERRQRNLLCRLSR
jgi:hypothetical protein